MRLRQTKKCAISGTHLPALVLVDGVRHLDRTRLDRRDAGVTRLREEIFLNPFGEGTFEVGNVEGDSLDFGIVEGFHRECVLNESVIAGQGRAGMDGCGS